MVAYCYSNMLRNFFPWKVWVSWNRNWCYYRDLGMVDHSEVSRKPMTLYLFLVLHRKHAPIWHQPRNHDVLIEHVRTNHNFLKRKSESFWFKGKYWLIIEEFSKLWRSWFKKTLWIQIKFINLWKNRMNGAAHLVSISIWITDSQQKNHMRRQ